MRFQNQNGFPWLCSLCCLAFLAGCQTAPDCTQDGGVTICDGLPRPSGTGAGTILTFTSIEGTPVAQVSGTTEELNNITFGGDAADGGLFVAVGSAGVIVTSPDAVHWTSQESQTPASLYGVAYGNNEFVAVGGNTVAAIGVILTGTPDGTTWTPQPVSGTLTQSLTGVVYADGQFVAVGNNQVLSSPDGIDWNALPAAPSGITGPTVDLYNTAYGNNLFVTVGTYNTSTSNQEIADLGFIATSPDASHWAILPSTPNYLSGVTYGAGQFVTVGREGSILTSSDGTTWTTQSAPGLNLKETPYLISVIYAGGQFVAAGNDVGINPSTGFLLTSPDAVHWTLLPGSDANLYGLAYGVVGGVGTYVAVGGQ
jgi:hypothetical protein